MARWLFLIGLAAACSAGCATLRDATHVAGYHLFLTGQETVERIRNRKWAEGVWEQMQARVPCEHREEYGKGFKEGFAEHLYSGTMHPPPLPPPCYRGVKYQTPQGYQAIECWFAGYRHGIATAHEGGYRRWVVGPSCVPTPVPVPEVDLAVPQISLKDVAPVPTAIAPDETPDRAGELPAARGQAATESAAPVAQERVFRIRFVWDWPW